MYNRVLVATDLTNKSHLIIKKAYELANQFDGKLYIIHVVEPIPLYIYPGILDRTDEQVKAAKKQLAAVADKYLVPEQNQIVVVGKAKEEILNKAQELNIDLIVIGSHNQSTSFHLLGSVANAILHTSECDVVTVKVK